MKKLLVLTLALMLGSTAQAQWGKRVKGNGNMTTINRSVGNYDGIAIAGFFDVVLVSGKEGDLKLEGEANLLEHITTEVKNGKLTVKIEKGKNLSPSWGNNIKVTIPVSEIDEVTLSGSGDIASTTTLKAETFKTAVSGSGDVNFSIEANSTSVTVSGSGDIALQGNTTDLEIRVSGSGDVNAFQLDTKFAKVTISGSADVSVNASVTLTARVSGSGDVSYKGNPKKIDTKVSGSGDINKY